MCFAFVMQQEIFSFFSCYGLFVHVFVTLVLFHPSYIIFIHSRKSGSKGGLYSTCFATSIETALRLCGECYIPNFNFFDQLFMRVLRRSSFKKWNIEEVLLF